MIKKGQRKFRKGKKKSGKVREGHRRLGNTWGRVKNESGRSGKVREIYKNQGELVHMNTGKFYGKWAWLLSKSNLLENEFLILFKAFAKSTFYDSMMYNVIILWKQKFRGFIEHQVHRPQLPSRLSFTQLSPLADWSNLDNDEIILQDMGGISVGVKMASFLPLGFPFSTWSSWASTTQAVWRPWRRPGDCPKIE